MAGVRLEFAQFGKFDSFNIYRNQTSTSISNVGNPIANTNTMYYEDFGVEQNNDYYYRVGVIRDQSESISDEIYVKTVLDFDPPHNIQGTWNNTTQSVDITWEFDE